MVDLRSISQLESLKNTAQRDFASAVSGLGHEHLETLFLALASPDMPLSDFDEDLIPVVRLVAISGVLGEMQRRLEVAEIESGGCRL